MSAREFKVGDRVRFKDPAHERSWFLDDSVGFVVGITKYGPLDPMVTARFGSRGVHVAGCFFEIIDE